MSRCARIVVAALVLPAALPAGASAGVADVRTMAASLLVPTASQARYTAAPGEHNTVTVESPASDTWIFRDAGATVTAGTGCTTIDAHAAVCRQLPRSFSIGGYGASVYAGDGADQVTSTGTDIEMRGEAGDDTLLGNGRLVGGPGDDTLTAGDRNDTLVGGDGRDVLSGGAGPDELVGGDDLFEIGDALEPATEPGDRIDGGPGVDMVSYHNVGGTRVDLAAGRGGPRGAPDVLRGVEDVEGGPGADTIIGDGAPNKLIGATGDDRLEGGAGADFLDGQGDFDTLLGGAGDDDLRSGERMSGGPGDDHLSSLDNYPPATARPPARIDGGSGNDTIAISAIPKALACGPGRDVLTDQSIDRSVSLGGLDIAPCERIVMAADALGIAVRPVRARDALGVTLRCPGVKVSTVRGCTGNVTLRLVRSGAGARTLGRGTFALRAVARRSVRVALSAAERRLLARTPRPLVAVRVFVTVATPGDPNGPEITTRYAWSWRARLAGG